MKHTAEDKRQSLESLKKMLKPGDKVYTVLRHVSRSGMQREISLFISKKNEMICLDWYVERLGSYRRGKHDGLVIGGCGMDMGFELVYQLGYALWPNGTPKPHSTRNGEPDKDGGYALKQSWM